MNAIEVLDLIIKQIGDLRVPVREEALREQIMVILGNVIELRKAAAAQTDEQTEEQEQSAECACSSAEEVAESV